MSREFGEQGGYGYFHDRIEQCVDDLKSAHNENARKWLPFLKEFHKVAYAISSLEAGDWNEAGYILQMITSMSILKEEFEKLEKHVDLYKEIIRRVTLFD